MREYEGLGAWSSAPSGSLVRDRSLAPPVFRGFRDHAASKVQAQAGFKVLGIDLVAGRLDMFGKLLGRSEEARRAAVHLEVDAEPLAPPGVDLAHVNHAGEDGLRRLRLVRCERGRHLRAVKLEEGADNLLLKFERRGRPLFDLRVRIP